MTYKVPNPDAFDGGSPQYNTNVVGWSEVEPTNSGWTAGRLNDAYSGLLESPRDGACASSMFVSAGGGAASDPSMWHRREMWQANVTVSARFAVYIDPTSTITMRTRDIGIYALMARFNAATTQSVPGNIDARWLELDCYTLEMRPTTSDAVTFLVKRYNAGTATTLATVTLSASTMQNVRWDLGWTLRLTTTDNGSSVDYEASIEDFEMVDGSHFVIIPITSGTDSSPITGTGRAGFGMSAPESLVGGFNRAPCCTEFSVADSAQPDTVLFREDWVRFLAALALTTSAADGLGNTGQTLMGDYLHDQYTDAASGQNLEQIVPSGGTGKSRLLLGGVVKYAAPFLRYRKAIDAYDQSSRVALQFSSGTSTGALPDGTAGGPIVRGDIPGQTVTPAHPGTSDATLLPYFKGYLLLCFANDAESPLLRVQLMRYTGLSTGVGTVIAKKNANNQFPLAADFSARLDVQTPGDLAPTGDKDTANVILKAYLDTGSGWSQVVLGTPSANVTIDANGTVTDADTSRVQSGFGTGFMGGGVNTSRSVWFDDFGGEIRERIDTKPVITENELAGQAVQVTINDILSPSFTVTVATSEPSLVTQFLSGHRATMPAFGDASGGIQRRTFSFNADATTADEHHRVEAFFNATKAAEAPFNYTDENGVDVVVIFASDKITRTQQAPNVWGTSFKLLELVDIT